MGRWCDVSCEKRKEWSTLLRRTRGERKRKRNQVRKTRVVTNAAVTPDLAECLCQSRDDFSDNTAGGMEGGVGGQEGLFFCLSWSVSGLQFEEEEPISSWSGREARQTNTQLREHSSRSCPSTLEE